MPQSCSMKNGKYIQYSRIFHTFARVKTLAESPCPIMRCCLNNLLFDYTHTRLSKASQSSLWPASYPASWAAILHLPAEHPVDKVHIQALPDSFRQQIVLLLLVCFRIEDIQLANIQPFPPA